MTTRRQFTERQVQRRADTRAVKIVSRNDDATYECDDTRTKQRLRAAPTNPRDSFAIGQQVLVSSPDSSRTIIGSGNVIIATSPEEARAVARNARVAQTNIMRGSIITSVDPNPVVVHVNDYETIVTATAYGTRLTTAAPIVPDIGNRINVGVGGGDGSFQEYSFNPDGDSPVGVFDVVLSGVKIPELLHLVAHPLPSLMAAAHDPTAPEKTLFGINPDTLEAEQYYGTQADSARTVLLADNGVVYSHNGAQALRWRASTGSVFAPQGQSRNVKTGQAADQPGSNYWWIGRGTAGGDLWRMTKATVSSTAYIVGTGGIVGVAYVDPYVYFADTAYLDGIKRFHTGTLVTSNVPLGVTVANWDRLAIAQDATYVYVNTSRIVFRIHKQTLTADTINVDGAADLEGRYAVIHDNRLAVASNTAGAYKIRLIDLTTFSVVATSGVLTQVRAMAMDATSVYYGGSSTTLYKLSRPSLTAVTNRDHTGIVTWSHLQSLT
jgi:hypothetical protein